VARVAWVRERSQKTADQYSTALKRFNEFLCAGVIPQDLGEAADTNSHEEQNVIRRWVDFGHPLQACQRPRRSLHATVRVRLQ
jgi:hypothetical protein